MPVRPTLAVFVAAMLSVLSTAAFPARPFLTDDPGINTAGAFEYMAACDFWNQRANPSMQLRHGITERMDFGLNVGYTALPQDERRFSGADFNMKLALVKDLFALGASGTFGKTDYCVYGILGKSLGPITGDVNIGYSAQADSSDADLPYYAALMYEWKKAGLGVEIGGNQEKLNWWQFGGRIYIKDWLHYDAGFGGDFEREPDFNVTTGIDVVFPLDKK